MPLGRITEFPASLRADIADDDALVIVDRSQTLPADRTRHVNYSELAAVYADQVVAVSMANGSDSSGRRGRLDRPFQSLAAAEAASSSGDCVLVYPGTYMAGNLGTKDLTWNFFPAARVTGTVGHLIYSVSTNVRINICGFGEFIAAAGQPCILQSGPTSIMDIDARSFTGSSTVVLDLAQGTSTVRNAYILNSGASGTVVSPDGPDGRVRLINCDIRNPNSSAAAIRQENSGPVLTLQGCVIVTGALASIESPNGSQVRIYNGTMSNKAADVDTTFIVGALTVDTDVT
jgi:hypothetical protein